MRYHWGMGVGHVYSHGEQKQDDVEEDMNFEEEELAAEGELSEEDQDIYDRGEEDPWSHDSDQEDSDNPGTWSEDEELLELENTYN